MLSVMVFSVPSKDSPEADRLTDIEEMTGKLSSQDEEDKLMHSVLENDRALIDDGKLIKDALNQGLNSFTPDLFFEKLVKDWKIARKIIGKHLLYELTGYDENYIEKNLRIPEFQKIIKKKIEDKWKTLKAKGLIDSGHRITEKGIYLAGIVLYKDELDKLIPKGLVGDKLHKKASIHGDPVDIHDYKRGDLYKNISIRKTVKSALRRGRTELSPKDLKVFEKESKGSVYIIYAMDASGSMKGQKIDSCKKAGIALAFKAIESKDKVGLLIFGKGVLQEIPPTSDFNLLLSSIANARAGKETDIAGTINRAIELFPEEDVTRHLMIITDAVPTFGDDPKKATLDAAEHASMNGITISVIGINLDSEGESLARKISDIGKGKLYSIRDTEDMDLIVLEDYSVVA